MTPDMLRCRPARPAARSGSGRREWRRCPHIAGLITSLMRSRRLGSKPCGMRHASRTAIQALTAHAIRLRRQLHERLVHQAAAWSFPRPNCRNASSTPPVPAARMSTRWPARCSSASTWRAAPACRSGAGGAAGAVRCAASKDGRADHHRPPLSRAGAQPRRCPRPAGGADLRDAATPPQARAAPPRSPRASKKRQRLDAKKHRGRRRKQDREAASVPGAD